MISNTLWRIIFCLTLPVGLLAVLYTWLEQKYQGRNFTFGYILHVAWDIGKEDGDE
jgi:hypothetical protein